MRLTLDILIGLMVTGVLVAVIVMQSERSKNREAIEDVRASLKQLHEKTDYHTALESAMQGQDTLIVHIEESWFGDDLPKNALLDAKHPWIDLAPPGDLGAHPPDPIVTRPDQAAFWYNPTTGVFRARVKPHANEAKTLALYNEVNNTYLSGLEDIPDPSRNPIAHQPGKVPAKQYASMANKIWSKSEVDIKIDLDHEPDREPTVVESLFDEPLDLNLNDPVVHESTDPSPFVSSNETESIENTDVPVPAERPVLTPKRDKERRTLNK